MPAVPVKRIDASQFNLKEQVVSINRVTKVVKGGKNMSFSALVVVGDPTAKVVGYGTGKAKEVPAAIKKGIESAKKNLKKINLLETTIRQSVFQTCSPNRSVRAILTTWLRRRSTRSSNCATRTRSVRFAASDRKNFLVKRDPDYGRHDKD
jgi:hypothetical protein